MGFVMTCDNKKCGKSQEPMLDKESGDVYCSECNEVIKNITIFAKNSMRSLGQFKRTIQAQEAFSVGCKKCNKSACPKLSGGKLVCKNCGVEHNLTPILAQSIKVHLGSKGVM